jgi:hypothetical protein
MARAGVGDAETHGDFVEETGFRQRRSPGHEVIADEKDDFKLAGLHFIGAQQRLVGPSVRVGFGGGDERPVVAFEQPQFDLHSLCRAAVGGVQDVSAKFGRHVSWKLNRSGAVRQS